MKKKIHANMRYIVLTHMIIKQKKQFRKIKFVAKKFIKA